MAFIARLLYAKWFPPDLPTTPVFQSQTILITGGTGGLGLEAAIQYINLGASRVIITGRTLSRGHSAAATIEARTGKTGIVEVRELDMSTLAGVKTFVDALVKDINSIDVVLLNAGVYTSEYQQSPDGWEEILQVNTLSTVLLGLLLLPWMKASKPPNAKSQHLGFVSSGLHTRARIDGDGFPEESVLRYCSGEEQFSVPGNYGLSKLFMMYGVKELANLAVEEDGHPIRPSPIINTMCPGLCKSDLSRSYSKKGILMSLGVAAFYSTLARSAESGARTLVLATLTGPEEHGKYVRHYSTVEEYVEQAARNITSEKAKELQPKVWHEMLQIFEAALPGATDITPRES